VRQSRTMCWFQFSNSARMNATAHPLVSIVTPAYNEEKYLSECIESVLAQTYPNWEYTIINNRSTDKTLEIAQAYAAINPRIRVCTNETFVPALANFNNAIRRLSPVSKYCKMILADDWIFPECLERMVAVMEEHPTVGIVGAYGLVEPWVLWTGLPYPSTCVSGREVCRQRLLGGPYVFGSPTSVLFRSDLVRGRDPFYNESNVAADSEACFELLKDSDFGFVHQVLTFSRDGRANSRLEESRELNTAAPSILHELIVYGPYFLNPKEYAERLRTLVAKYYDFLATSMFRGRNQKFREYHKEKLREEGITFSYARLAYALAKLPLRLLFSSARSLRSERLWGL
jgi:glycosyltransferase involved in cell wall biosynthesis